MRLLGIDLAASPARTYACQLVVGDNDLAAEVFARCDDDQLMALARGAKRVAIDAPFGWPDPFVDAVAVHREAGRWPAPEGEDPAIYRRALSYRLTDQITAQARRPLSVSTDRLGVTAMRCAYLLSRWSHTKAVDRAGAGRFIEVYPAAALIRWGLSPAGYKARSGTAALKRLLRALREGLPELELTKKTARLCSQSHDGLDALIAALVARAHTLGLTTRPLAAQLHRARTEGWIHLPDRASLPLLAGGVETGPSRAVTALAARLREQGRRVDAGGYAAKADGVLLASMPKPARRRVFVDLSGKGGSETVARARAQPKIQAAHSSAALSANCFWPWLGEEIELTLAGQTFSGSGELEAECPTGLRGTPPTLDFLVRGERVLAVESKCTEYFNDEPPAEFAPSYDAAFASVHASWRREFERLRLNPRRYRHLDAGQLLKHYLGLRRTFPKSRVTLAYLYWEPTSAKEIAACLIHRAEVAKFASGLADPRIRFVSHSWPEIWMLWSASGQPAPFREHAHALLARYEVEI